MACTVVSPSQYEHCAKEFVFVSLQQSRIGGTVVEAYQHDEGMAATLLQTGPKASCSVLLHCM